MKTQNFTQLIGYLGADPISRTAVNGSKIARLRLATDYYRRDNAGNVIHKVTWHEIKAWDSLAEKVMASFIKSSHVMIQGQIDHRSFINDHGQKQFVTEIRATSITDLDR